MMLDDHRPADCRAELPSAAAVHVAEAHQRRRRLLVLFLVLIRLIWGWDANRQLRAHLEAIRARGEPVTAEDLTLPHVPDAENFVFHIDLATAAFNTKAQPPHSLDKVYPRYPPDSLQWQADARNAITGNQATLQLTRKARQFTRVDFGMKYDSPGAFGVGRLFVPYRQIGALLHDAALYRHMEGNDAEAIELIHDALAITEAVDQQPADIAHLLGIGINAMMMEAVHMIAPELRVEGAADPSAAPIVAPAARERVRALIADLIRIADRPMTRAMQGQRIQMLEYHQSLVPNNLILGPMYLRDMLARQRELYQMRLAAQLPTWPEAQRTIPSAANPAPDDFTQLLTLRSAQSQGRHITTDFRVRAEIRMAAVALAVRLYQLDHDGRWPARLDALVPAYLPAVPTDPFSQSMPLGYFLARNGTRPILYSIGDDGDDDFYPPFTDVIDESKLLAEPIYTWNTRILDQWRDLSRFKAPSTAAPATTPASNP